MVYQPSKAQKIAGIVLTVLPGLMLVMSSSMKLMQGKEVVENFTKLGFAESLVMPLGMVEFLSAVLFLVPKTSFVGAILITGYMGGAICTHLRLGEPFMLQLAIGVVAWVGYGLRRPDVIKSAF